MSGRHRLPAGEPRKASQRRSRHAAPSRSLAIRHWHVGNQVHWRDRIGVFSRDLGDGEHAEVKIGDRTYQLRTAELF